MKVLIIALSLILAAQGEEGICSYYGKEIPPGSFTASGEIFNWRDLTAAHKTLPFGTWITVTNHKNRRSVKVRINDRGPFVPGRIVDLSYAAAQKLDMISDGVVPCSAT